MLGNGDGGSGNQTFRSNENGNREQGIGGKNRVILEEKYFQRMHKFERDLTDFVGWMFDLLVAVGQVDKELSKELDCLLRQENWDKCDSKRRLGGVSPPLGRPPRTGKSFRLFVRACVRAVEC